MTGLEPETNFQNNRLIELKLGRVPILAPAHAAIVTIEFRIRAEAESVKAVAQRLATMQGAKNPELQQTPEKKD